MVYFDKIGKVTLAASFLIISAQSAYGMDLQLAEALKLSEQTSSVRPFPVGDYLPDDPEAAEAALQSLLEFSAQEHKQDYLNHKQDYLNNVALELGMAASMSSIVPAKVSPSSEWDPEELLQLVSALTEEEVNGLPEKMQMSIIAAQEAKLSESQRPASPSFPMRPFAAGLSANQGLGAFLNTPENVLPKHWQKRADLTESPKVEHLLASTLSLDPAEKALQEEKERRAAYQQQTEEQSMLATAQRMMAVWEWEDQKNQSKQEAAKQEDEPQGATVKEIASRFGGTGSYRKQ